LGGDENHDLEPRRNSDFPPLPLLVARGRGNNIYLQNLVNVCMMPPHVSSSEELWDVDEGGSLEPPENDYLTTHRVGTRSVTFFETVSCREIAPLTELSDEEIATVWYSDDEYTKIKEHVTGTLKRVSNGETAELEEGFCMRGLEGRTRFGGRRRKNNKAAALDAVWTTQIQQWRKKQNNPIQIAAAYKPHSLRAKYPAIETGQRDERFVKDVVGPVVLTT
jgi:hypothetical protein